MVLCTHVIYWGPNKRQGAHITTGRDALETKAVVSSRSIYSHLYDCLVRSIVFLALYRICLGRSGSGLWPLSTHDRSL